jgi:2-C-methyl-D-erythritol 4-phosphate cytidylyltransferase
MRWGAVIVAAGRGERFGRPKQLVEVAGRPMVAWSIAVFGTMPEVVDLAVAVELEHVETVTQLVQEFAPRIASHVVAGGASRQHSVRAALAALPERCAGVLVHDGARPLVLARDVRAGMRVVRKGTASLLASPVVDTVKVVDHERGLVLRTLDRSEIWSAETPQFALASELRRVHADAARNGVVATDDATLLERAGLDVVVVPSSADNFKVTLPGDRDRAEALLLERVTPADTEEDVLLVEAFVDEGLAIGVAHELESRRGRIDAIDRDLPNAVIVRAYVPAEGLRGFGERFAELAGPDAIFTTHHSHVAPRAHPTAE